jgi:hypothetical protein
MSIAAKLMHVAAALMLLGSPLLTGAQTSQATLDSFISQNVGDAESLYSATIDEWTLRHPGETVEAPADRNRDYHPENARSQQERKLEGRWCLASPCLPCLQKRAMHFESTGAGSSKFLMNSRGARIRKTLRRPLPSKFRESVRRSLADLSNIQEMITGIRSAPFRNSAAPFPTIICSYTTRKYLVPTKGPLFFSSRTGELWITVGRPRRPSTLRQGSLGSRYARP